MTATLDDDRATTVITAGEFMGRTGLTYRQLDHWTRAGYLRSETRRTGTGRPRTYTAHEAEIAVHMVRMINAGLELRTAHDIARGDGMALHTLMRAIFKFGEGIMT